MKKLYLLITLFSCCFCLPKGFSQIEKANSAFDNLEYYKAIDLYSYYLASHSDLKAQINLAKCYVFTNQYLKAERSLSRLEHHFIYYPKLKRTFAQILLINGKGR